MAEQHGSGSSTDERLSALHGRLMFWWCGRHTGGTELREVWDDAFRRFDRHLRDELAAHPDGEEDLVRRSPRLLLECFEGSVADHDHVLATFPSELPEGWHEWDEK
jgi:hypothetical protein